MIKGILIFTFNEKSGMNLKTKFPEDIELDPNILMRIYTLHAYDRNLNTFSLTIGSLNIATLYTGAESDLYISLLLDPDDDPDDLNDILNYAGKQLLRRLSQDQYLDLIPSIFSRIVHVFKKKYKI